MTMDQYGNLDCERKPPAAEINAELLAALKVIVEVGGIGPDDMFDDARDAIARAEGDAA